MKTITVPFLTFIFYCMTAVVLKAAEVITPEPISGKDSSSLADILPADVLARVNLLRDELELIRFEMGKPKNTQKNPQLKQAAPREVFFQALTLFQKSDRLGFEQTRKRGETPRSLPAAQIRPVHVWHAVDKALKRLLIIKRKLEIKEKVAEKIQPTSIEPTDVFIAIVQANRQLNLMLDQQFSPSDVFQQVSKAINYNTRLLATFEGVKRLPDTPAYKRGQRPDNVYKRLLGCYAQLVEITKLSKVNMLVLTEDIKTIRNKTPSDVYDIASLLVSELAYLHSLLEESEAPAGVYYPGRKFPSHVYQRAGILEAQLATLLEQVNKNQKWLGTQ